MPIRPIISVIIDTYNYAAFVENAIDSVIAQTIALDLIEIIVVDDGSIDDTGRRVLAYGDRVKYHHKENGGQGSAFNVGISVAQGEYVAFLDADDYFYPTKLAEVLKVFNSDKKIGIVFNRFDFVDEKGKIRIDKVPFKLYQGSIINRVLLGYVSGVPSSGICIRKEIVEKITIPEQSFRISADYFYINIVPLLTNVGVVETTEHAYRIHSSNLYINKKSEENIIMHLKQNAAIYEVAENIGFSFFKGLHDLDCSPKAITIRGRISILVEGIFWLFNNNGERCLRIRSFAKLIIRFFFPGQIYSKFQQIKKLFNCEV